MVESSNRLDYGLVVFFLWTTSWRSCWVTWVQKILVKLLFDFDTLFNNEGESGSLFVPTDVEDSVSLNVLDSVISEFEFESKLSEKVILFWIFDVKMVLLILIVIIKELPWQALLQIWSYIKPFGWFQILVSQGILCFNESLHKIEWSVIRIKSTEKVKLVQFVHLFQNWSPQSHTGNKPGLSLSF